jgi:hypothetical protein
MRGRKGKINKHLDGMIGTGGRKGGKRMGTGEVEKYKRAALLHPPGVSGL